MSSGTYVHTHIVTVGINSTRAVHDPDGRLIGYIKRVQLSDQNGHILARPGYEPQDEHGVNLAGNYCDTFDRALEFVVER